MIKEKLKTIVKKYKQIQRQKEIKKTALAVKKDKIVKDLRNLGIHNGDVVFVHSSLKSIGYVEGGAQTVIEALLESVSFSGTLIVPTYHMVGGTMYNTCLAKNYVFDVRTTETRLGIIPSTFLKFPGVQRSIHPTHSVSAIGKHAKYVIEAHHLASSTFGSDSPWDRLVKLKGKVLGIGVSMGPVTFYHMLEDMMFDKFPLPVRMKKTYYLKCKDWDGSLIEVPVNPLDPEFSKIRIDTKHREDLREYFWNEFKRVGLLKVGWVGQAASWFIPAENFFNHLVSLMKKGITIYSTHEEFKKKPLPKFD